MNSLRILLALCVFTLIGCSRVESDWQKATEDDSPKSEEAEWQIALAKKTEKALNTFMERFPESKHSEEAKEAIWVIQWPPVSVEKVDNVTFFINGYGFRYGYTVYSLGQNGKYTGVLGKGEPAGPVQVWIWINIAPGEKATMDKLGLRAGYAYLVPKDNDINKLKLIRKVDLSLGEPKICSQFGVGIEDK